MPGQFPTLLQVVSKKAETEMSILPLAAELNSILESEAPAVLEMLSGLGKRLYFPKGIILSLIHI